MSLSAKIETTANAATIVVAVLLSTFLVKAYFYPKVIPRATTAVVPEVVKGKSMDGRIPGVDWKKNQRTLVLAISTTCHFCTESAPFFRRLKEADNGLKTVAVLPQPIAEARQYLDGVGVHVDELRQIPLNTLGVRGTPTMLLVNDAGVVEDVWAGKLPAEQESEVLAALKEHQ